MKRPQAYRYVGPPWWAGILGLIGYAVVAVLVFIVIYFAVLLLAAAAGDVQDIRQVLP